MYYFGNRIGKGYRKKSKRTVQNELVKEDEWIIDGNYGGTMDIRMNAADTIIFLDIHRTICVYHAFKRVVQYRNKTRPDMGAGCEERFDLQFLNGYGNILMLNDLQL